MWPTVVILVVVCGTIVPLLLPATRELARRFWPGPTVKGPADVYVQAFQALICLAVLTVAPIAMTVIAFAIAASIGWRTGLWLSSLPLAGVTVGWAGVWLRGRMR